VIFSCCGLETLAADEAGGGGRGEGLEVQMNLMPPRSAQGMYFFFILDLSGGFLWKAW
jgi:hypothetical protein